MLFGERYKIKLNFREINFVHIGRIEKERKNRIEILDSLKETQLSYKLFGPQKGISEFIKAEKLYSELRKCIFGLAACGASKSTSYSSPNIFDRFQFKGKLWDYMICGCIPVIDFAPSLNLYGFKEGYHYLNVSNFSSEQLREIAEIEKVKLLEMRENIYSLASKLSIKDFKSIFGNFIERSKFFKN